MSNKNKIKELIVTWDSYEISGKLTEIIQKLQTTMKSNRDHFDFEIDVESESGYYNSCSTTVTIRAYRWETDKEFEDRKSSLKRAQAEKLLKAKRDAEANEKRERSLYESLKRKFDKEINETNQ
jgi:F0F1-type ATP synthase epsilon subunit